MKRKPMHRGWCFAFIGMLVTTSLLADESPITRLAGVSFTVADLDKANQFYTELMGLKEAFRLQGPDGKTQSISFRINDDQFLEFSAGDVENFRFDRVTLLVTDLQRVAAVLKKSGIAPSEPAKSADGAESITIRDPDRMEIRFTTYSPGSKQAAQRGQPLGPKQVADHLHHAALAADNEAATLAIFKDTLRMKEFSRGPMPGDIRWINLSVPGPSGDLLEFMVAASQPAAARQHIGFEVPNIQQTYSQLTERGLKQQNRPFAAAIGRWIWFIRDPNNIRIEFMGQPTENPPSK
jgi:catechol 2,3-dioxygenase-like lactoylglutathione lyase family enzyme